MADITFLEGLLTSFAMFANVGLRVTQQKLVIANRYVAVFGNAWMIETANVAVVLSLVNGGWAALPYTGAGASAGAVCALFYHNMRNPPNG